MIKTCAIEGCDAPLIARGWCVKHYQRWRSNGDPLISRRSRGSLVDRFWAKVDKNGPVPIHAPELGPCWVWTGCTFPSGYGQIWVGGEKRIDQAHRVVFQLEGETIPEGVWVRHRCDNPPCVRRVSHLILGTAQQNVEDRQERNRTARGLWTGVYTHPESRLRGERNGAARLTESQVREIRDAVLSRGTVSALARAMGVSRSTIVRARVGANWMHVR
jgi:hypothetical protein